MRKPWTKAEDGWLDLLLRPVKIPEVSELFHVSSLSVLLLEGAHLRQIGFL